MAFVWTNRAGKQALNILRLAQRWTWLLVYFILHRDPSKSAFSCDASGLTVLASVSTSETSMPTERIAPNDSSFVTRSADKKPPKPKELLHWFYSFSRCCIASYSCTAVYRRFIPPAGKMQKCKIFEAVLFRVHQTGASPHPQWKRLRLINRYSGCDPTPPTSIDMEMGTRVHYLPTYRNRWMQEHAKTMWCKLCAISLGAGVPFRLARTKRSPAFV